MNANNFMSLLGYVPYLKEEKTKIQIFISFLSFSYRGVAFDNQENHGWGYKEGNLFFNQNKQKGDNSKRWMTKKHESSMLRKKDLRNLPFPAPLKVIKEEIIAEM